MARKPVVLGRREIGAGLAAIKVLAIHLLVIKPVFILDPVHGGIQFLQQIGTGLVHPKEKRRGSYLAKRYSPVCAASLFDGVGSHKKVNIAAAQLLQRILFPARHIHNVRLDAVFLRPGNKLVFYHAAFINACLFPVKGSIVIQGNGFITVRNIDIIFLFPHRQGGIQYVLRPFFFIRNIAQQINFALLQHFEKFRPACGHIFILPPCIGRYLLLVFIGIAGPSAIGIRPVEGRFEPAYPHGFFLCSRSGRIGITRFRRKGRHGKKKSQQHYEAGP